MYLASWECFQREPQRTRNAEKGKVRERCRVARGGGGVFTGVGRDWAHTQAFVELALGARPGMQTHFKMSISKTKWSELPNIRLLHPKVK